MNYILLILSGFLGIFGTIFETHKEIQPGKKKLNLWGTSTIIALSIILCLSLYKEFHDDKEAIKIANENEYLKLSESTLKRDYYFEIHFSNPLFNENIPFRIAQKKKAQQETIKWYESLDNDYKSANQLSILLNQYNSGFFDSISRNKLFNNKDYLEEKGTSPLARIDINAGILEGYIDFERDGLTTPMFAVNSAISDAITNTKKQAMDTIDAKFFYEKTALYVKGKLNKTVKAGTIYGSIMREYEQNKISSSISIYFDKKPQETIIQHIDENLNNIKKIILAISYDPDAIRWLVIKFTIDKKYILKPSPENKNKWILIKSIKYADLPHITDKSKN